MTDSSIKLSFDTAEAKAAIAELTDMASALSDKVDAAIEIKRVRIQPGDTIVIRTEKRLTSEMHKMISDYVRKGVAVEDIKVLVLDSGLAMEVLSATP